MVAVSIGVPTWLSMPPVGVVEVSREQLSLGRDAVGIAREVVPW